MDSLGTLIMEKSINELSYQYSVENLKLDVESKGLKIENKNILNNLILDLEQFEKIIKRVNKVKS